MSTDLVEFLRARLDTEEVEARAAQDVRSDYHAWHQVMDLREAGMDEREALHVVTHSPARVLAEVDAKRELIAQILNYEANGDGEVGCCHDGDQIGAGKCPVINPNEIPALRALALPYASHPDYRQEWRP